MRRPHAARRQRLAALVAKEGLQVMRDPAALIIAFVLPVVLLLLFAYAVSLDVRQVRIGLVAESDSAAAHSLGAAFDATRYFDVTPARDRRDVAGRLAAGELRGFIVIPQDFDRRLTTSRGDAPIQIIADGAQPNTARFVGVYAEGVFNNWLADRTGAAAPALQLTPRFWFNPELDSRRVLIPGAIAIVMTMIGTLLTALVVAREWERGTMEAIFSTPAGMVEIILGKIAPYFALGLLATLGCAALAQLAFDVPLRGSWAALLLLACVFLVPALGQGLLISTLAKNQFVASQVALLSGFLPAFLLSGFLFEINSMPAFIRGITLLVPARYFVTSLQTVFLAGDVWSVLLPNMAAMLGLGAVFFGITARHSRKSLDT